MELFPLKRKPYKSVHPIPVTFGTTRISSKIPHWPCIQALSHTSSFSLWLRTKLLSFLFKRNKSFFLSVIFLWSYFSSPLFFPGLLFTYVNYNISQKKARWWKLWAFCYSPALLQQTSRLRTSCVYLMMFTGTHFLTEQRSNVAKEDVSPSRYNWKYSLGSI